MVDDRHGTKATALARDLVPLLPGWSIDPGVPPEHGCAEIVRGSDHARVRIRVGPWHHEGRVVFTGVWPCFADRTMHHHAGNVVVTVDARRPIADMAKAVSGRLLAAYGPAYAEALAYVRRADARAAEARLVASHLAHAAAGSIRGDGWMKIGDGVGIQAGLGAVHRLQVRPAYGSGDYAQEVRVDFEVHGLAPEVAAEVLDVIRRAEERAAAPAAATRVAEASQVHDDPDDEADEPQLRLAVGRP